MKVMIVRNSYNYNFGGAEKLSVFFAKELALCGIDVLVVSKQPKLLRFAKTNDISSHNGWWWSKQNWSGVSILLTPIYLLWQILLVGWYMHTIVRNSVDILHLMSKDDFIAGTIAGRLLRKGVVWTDCADLKFLFRNHRIWYKNPVGKLVFFVSRFASTVTIVSNNEKRLIEFEIGKKLGTNFEVMYAVGANQKINQTAPRPDKAVIFCSTSRLVTDKGISELIEGFNIVSKSHTSAKLWIVGDGPEEETFKNQARNNSSISFFGYSDNPLYYLAAADIYVHPTYHEGFSLSLAEAAMLGKPMIATRVGGNPELVNTSNGMLVEVKNVNSLAKAMSDLAQNKKARELMGLHARQDFISKFDLSLIVKSRLISFYEKACR